MDELLGFVAEKSRTARSRRTGFPHGAILSHSPAAPDAPVKQSGRAAHPS
jgi:hypothetical protein